MNLIASNLLAIFVLTGLLIADNTDSATLSYTTTTSFCAISEGATALVTTSSILSVLLIGIDQHLAVVDPLRYRTRIDKLKCALLILAVWLISIVFGMLASLNPQPRGLWRLCNSGCLDYQSDVKSETHQVRFQASLVLDGNTTENANLEIEGEISIRDETYNATASAIIRNSTDPTYYSNNTWSYGLVYAIVYALLGYLVPFIAICWMYISIYTAARSNSERTRRNGSRPILPTGSFSEEGQKADSSVEDFRRIPKISSLSSIDENSELSPSQIISSPRSNELEHYQENIDEDVEAAGGAGSTVIFTVGPGKLDDNKRRDDDPADDNAKDSTKSKVPIDTLKAKFLSSDKEATKSSEDCTDPDLTKNKFPDVPTQRRKSSHDLMYEEMMIGCDKHPYEYEDDYDNSSDEDVDEEDSPRNHNFEEALPLSSTEGFARASSNNRITHNSTRSISVNFDLGDGEQQNNENSRMLGQNNENQNSNSSHAFGSPIHPPPIVTITPPGQKTIASSVPLHRVPSVKSTNSYIHNLKHRISNGSLFKYREETRAARISALVIVMGLICWTPYVYGLISRNLPTVEWQSRNDASILHPNLDTTALAFLILATCISPLLFGYRSRRIKRELRKIFCFKRELSYKNNRSLMAKKVLRRRHSGGTILGGFGGDSNVDHSRYNIFNCVYGRSRWPKEKVQFVQVPETALAVETCRSSFSSGASTQISSTSTDEC